MVRKEEDLPEGSQEPVVVEKNIRTIDIPLLERAALAMGQNGLGNVSLLVLEEDIEINDRSSGTTVKIGGSTFRLTSEDPTALQTINDLVEAAKAHVQKTVSVTTTTVKQETAFGFINQRVAEMKAEKDAAKAEAEHQIITGEIRLASTLPAHLVAVNILSTQLEDKLSTAAWYGNNLHIKASLIAEILTNSQIPPEDRRSIFDVLTILRDRSYGRNEDEIYELLNGLLAHFAPQE